MNIEHYIPVDKNLYHPEFQFDQVFLNIDFDQFITQPYLLNSKSLYLTPKNLYTLNTIQRTNKFLNLQLQYSKYLVSTTHYFDNQNSLKQQLKQLFKEQKKELELFLNYISHITSNTILT